MVRLWLKGILALILYNKRTLATIEFSLKILLQTERFDTARPYKMNTFTLTFEDIKTLTSEICFILQLWHSQAVYWSFVLASIYNLLLVATERYKDK